MLDARLSICKEERRGAAEKGHIACSSIQKLVTIGLRCRPYLSSRAEESRYELQNSGEIASIDASVPFLAPDVNKFDEVANICVLVKPWYYVPRLSLDFDGVFYHLPQVRATL